jgi:hypothetical protein
LSILRQYPGSLVSSLPTPSGVVWQFEQQNLKLLNTCLTKGVKQHVDIAGLNPQFPAGTLYQSKEYLTNHSCSPSKPSIISSLFYLKEW